MNTNRILLLVVSIFLLYLAITGRLDDVWDALTGKKTSNTNASEWENRDRGRDTGIPYSGNPNPPAGTAQAGYVVGNGGQVIFL